MPFDVLVRIVFVLLITVGLFFLGKNSPTQTQLNDKLIAAIKESKNCECQRENQA
jgi:hypothetical protein